MLSGGFCLWLVVIGKHPQRGFVTVNPNPVEDGFVLDSFLSWQCKIFGIFNKGTPNGKGCVGTLLFPSLETLSETLYVGTSPP